MLSLEAGSSFVARVRAELDLDVTGRPDLPLIEGGYVDSPGLPWLVAEFEHEWGIDIEDDEMSLVNLATPAAMVQVLRSKVCSSE